MDNILMLLHLYKFADNASHSPHKGIYIIHVENCRIHGSRLPAWKQNSVSYMFRPAEKPHFM